MSDAARIRALVRPAAPPVPLPPGLRPWQAEALGEWARGAAASAAEAPWGPPGLAVFAGVGAGKTLLSLLLAPPPTRALYLVPAALGPQLRADAVRWSEAHPGRVPRAPAILTHEALSAPSGRDALRTAAPDVLVIDEAHRFASPTSARWRRVVEYLRLRPSTRVVVLSGSLLARSILGLRHLLVASLRAWCPLPVDGNIDGWAAALDPLGEPTADDLASLFGVLGRPHGGDPKGAARRAFQGLLRRTPGVVLAPTADDVGRPLAVVRWRGPPLSAEHAEAVRLLEDRWELPDGTELVGALDYARAARTLAAGAWTRTVPGSAHPVWTAARAGWAAFVKEALAAGRATAPSDVVDAAAAGHLGPAASAALARWEAAAAAYSPPATETLWVDARYPEALASEAASHGPAPLLWTQSPEIGAALARALGATYHGAGSAPPTGGPAVASILVHGTGWAGAPAAGYARAWVVEPPAGGAAWEQLLGRLHRAAPIGTRGQLGGGVRFDVLTATRYGHGAIASGLRDAAFVEDATGAPQRLRMALEGE